MPITIGAKQESGFDDPIGLLGDCHRRIERFLSALLLVADQACGGLLNDDQRSALEKSLRYFSESAPKHTADEEESLFPRLNNGGDDWKDTLASIARLEQEHVQATIYHQEVDCLGRRWLAEGHLAASDFERLLLALTALDLLYRRHIKVEESIVFPFAARVLSHSQKTSIGIEMASRRGVQQKRAQ
jgi:hemerythrin-like domain-containing protein